MHPRRKLIVGMFLSLDGVMQAPGGPDEDTEGGFTHGGWTVPLFDEQLGQIMVELTSRAGGLVLGRRTYEGFASTWPQVGDDDPVAASLNRMPKYVASGTLKTVEWKNSTLLTGDVAEAVARLKQEPGDDLQVSGSGNLIQTLLAHDLVDGFTLIVFPVLLGSGKRLFAGGTIPAALRLVDSSTTATGVVVSRYERAGELRRGAVGPEYDQP
jgi:dihydrofolate reductase